MKLHLKFLKAIFRVLPGCMREITGTKYVCPRYWCLERFKSKKLWKYLWVTCAKEVREWLEKKF